MKLTKKLVIAFAISMVLALLAVLSISPPVVAARQAIFILVSNHASLYVLGVANIGFFGSLYLLNKADN